MASHERMFSPFTWIFLLFSLFLLAMLPSPRWIIPLIRHLHHGNVSTLVFWHARRVPLIGGGAALCLAGSIASIVWRRDVHALFARAAGALGSVERAFMDDTQSFTGLTLSQLAGWGLAIAALLFSLDMPTLRHGFFRFDDFEIVSLMLSHPLGEAVFMPHGDHTMPLLRVEVSLMHTLFGLHAAFYNTSLLVMLGALLFFGVLLLKEMKAGLMAAVMFVILTGAGSLWGEFLAGYYTISTYLQQTIMSVVACWAYLRWHNTGRNIFAAIAVLALVLAALLDISGFWVAAGFTVFVLAVKMGDTPSGWYPWLHRNRWMIAAAVMACSVVVLFNLYVFLVLSPHGFLSMSGEHPTQAQRLEQIWYYTSTALMMPVIPTAYWKLPAHLLTAILLAIDLAVLAVVLTARWLPRALWWLVLAGLVILVGNAVMVAIGRPQLGLGFPWQTKYIGSGFTWWMVSLCLLAGGLWQRAPRLRRPALLQWYLAAAISYIALQLGSGVAAASITDNAAGYPGYIVQAQQGRQAVEKLRETIAPLFAHKDDPSIPMLTGNFIDARYPVLFRYDMICYSGFIMPPGRHALFVQNAAMADTDIGGRDICHGSLKGPDPLVTVTSLRNASDEAFRQNLRDNPAAQNLYLAPIALAYHAAACAPPKQFLDSDGNAGRTIRGGSWDPEQAHLLRMTVQYEGPSPVARIALPFSSELSSASPNWLEIPAGQTICLRVDLLQLYSYALSNQVHDLRIRLATPGKYAVADLSLGG